VIVHLRLSHRCVCAAEIGAGVWAMVVSCVFAHHGCRGFGRWADLAPRMPKPLRPYGLFNGFRSPHDHAEVRPERLQDRPPFGRRRHDPFGLGDFPCGLRSLCRRCSRLLGQSAQPPARSRFSWCSLALCAFACCISCLLDLLLLAGSVPAGAPRPFVKPWCRPWLASSMCFARAVFIGDLIASGILGPDQLT